MRLYQKFFPYSKEVYSWCLYDWANSAFATTIMAAVLPNYYSTVAASKLAPNIASSYWGYSNTVAMVFIALLAPILGAIADHQSARKKYLSVFALAGILFTGLLYSVQEGDWFSASVFYIIARIGFSGGDIFYNALLPAVAPKDRIDQVSVLGYAVGYLGGGILLALNLHMILYPAFWNIADAQTAVRFSFLSVSIWWAVFTIPLLLNVREPHSGRQPAIRVNALLAGFRRLQETLKNIRKYRQLFRFLIAYWLYNDGIGTIIIMAVIFGTEIGIGRSQLIGAILLVQFVGIPFSILFGKISQWIGSKRAILLGLVVYTLICFGGYFMKSASHFWILALLVGTVQGGTQALSRSLFGSMVPANKSAEFFGFYDVSQKFSGILGPALFGLIGQSMGSSRWGIVALVVFFLSGGYLLLRVNEQEGRQLVAGHASS